MEDGLYIRRRPDLDEAHGRRTWQVDHVRGGEVVYTCVADAAICKGVVISCNERWGAMPATDQDRMWGRVMIEEAYEIEGD